ncbi:MAG: HAMP domain-containing histidine kinase [Alphaproteobacteria bacterium]|nr:HAMP domain-containing histidine kinase [Alphaproteobacteria bacterium]
MSLRLRLTLAIVLLVTVTLGLAWAITGRAVLRPLTREVFQDYMRQSMYVAHKIDEGVDPDVLEGELDLRIRVEEAPPPPPPGHPDAVDRRTIRGREVVYHRGPRNWIAVRARSGWVIVERDLDLDRPGRRGALALLIIALGVTGVAVWVAGRATRPLRTAQAAMERIAEGDLSHRLEVASPPELAAAARSFNTMVDRVEGMLRREKELMAGISHELRTPLTRLRLEMELLRDAGVSEKRVAAMEGDVAEIDRLVGELLQISRLELGQQTLHTRRKNLRALVDEVVEAVPLPKHTVEIEGEGVEVEVDPALLQRAVGNLLRNAGRYTPAGTTVTLILDGPTLTVADQGPGVPEEALPRLFEPFFRAEGSRAKATGGLGLGLMIVRQVLELHGGTATAWNRPGGGLAVKLSLPPEAAV